MKSGFLDKLIENLDRVDPEEVQRYVLKAVQEKGFLENVFDTLQEGIVVIGMHGVMHYVNRAALDFFGFSRQELIGQKLGDQLPGIVWDEIVGDNRSINRDIEVFYPEHRYLNFYISPLDPTQDEQGGYVLILRDDTQSRQVQKEEMESERIAALTMLAASVAHEIGNPLNSLNIHLQVLERKVKKKADAALAEELLESLEVTRSEIKRLNFIVENFLGSVRPSKPQLEKLDINEIIAEAVTLLAPEVQDRNITITLQLNPELPKLSIDSSQMKQVFHNLIRNSSQAIGSDGSIIISTQFDDYSVTLSFEDDGPGIASEDVSKVFDPYFTTKKTGSGLGLLIVNRIIREHAGSIEFKSEKNQGTTVNISLPRSENQIRFLPKEGSTTDVIDIDAVPS